MQLIRTSPSGPLVRTIDPSFNPLVGVAYVDRLTTVPLAEQNGSPMLPFTSLTTAIAALPGGGTLAIAPGDYSTEGSIPIGAGGWTLVCTDVHPDYVYGSQGLKECIIAGITATGAPAVNLIGVQVTGAISGVNGLSADSSWFAGAIDCSTLNGFDCRFTNTASIALTGGGMSLTDSRCDALVVTCPNAGIYRFVDCELNTSFSLTSGATGTLRICGRTNFFLQSITQTLTNVTIVNQDTPGLNPNQPTAIAATGALGVVSLGNMTSGGVLVFQPTGNYTIDGFTARSNGFWFDLLVDSTNQAFVGQVLQDVGSTTTSVRSPYNIPYQLVAGSLTRFRWQFNRWRVGPPTPAAQALISVAVPALVAAALGYVDVSLVGTALAGAPAGSQILAAPQGDLAAAGAAGGFYANCRVSATNTVRLAFVGTLAGGNVNFLFTRL